MSGDSAQAIGYADRARFYDLEYEESAGRDFFVSLLTPEIRSVLEIPCGVGNNTLHLARPGLRFVAVDREPNMIERLRRRIAASPVRYRDLELAVGDMREFDLGERFDLILIQREAFQLLTDRGEAQRALERLARHLAAGGDLVVDLATLAKVEEPDPALELSYFDPGIPDGEVVREWARDLDSGARLERWRRQDHRGGVVVITFDYCYRDPRGAIERWRAEVPLKVYTREEVAALAADAGLTPRHVYRDYERRPYTPGAARMIFFLRRTDEHGS